MQSMIGISKVYRSLVKQTYGVVCWAISQLFREFFLYGLEIPTIAEGVMRTAHCGFSTVRANRKKLVWSVKDLVAIKKLEVEGVCLCKESKAGATPRGFVLCFEVYLADAAVKGNCNLAAMQTHVDAEWDIPHAAVRDRTALQFFFEAECQKRQNVKRAIRSLEISSSSHLTLVDTARDDLHFTMDHQEGLCMECIWHKWHAVFATVGQYATLIMISH